MNLKKKKKASPHLSAWDTLWGRATPLLYPVGDPEQYSKEVSALALFFGRPHAAQCRRGLSLFSFRKPRPAQCGQALWGHMLR